MGKPWENGGNIGKPWESGGLMVINGDLMGFNGDLMGKPWENGGFCKGI